MIENLWTDKRISEWLEEHERPHHPSGAKCIPVEYIGRVMRQIRSDYRRELHFLHGRVERIRAANHKLARMLGNLKDLEIYDYYWHRDDHVADALLKAKARIDVLEGDNAHLYDIQATAIAFVGECLVELEKAAPEVHARLASEFDELVKPKEVQP